MPAAAYPITVAYLQGLTSVPIEHGFEESAMSYSEGALLVQDASSGELEECGADPTVVVGVALKPATGVAGSDVPYVPLHKGIIFEITANAQVTQANRHKLYGVALVSGDWVLDIAETTVTVFRIVDIPANMVSVDNPRVYVEAGLLPQE